MGSFIGLYHDEGVKEEGVLALKKFLGHYGFPYKILTSFDINSGKVFTEGMVLLWFPGGWAVPYNANISNAGMQYIREFVYQGNKLTGTCAGQYFISGTVIWEGIKYPYKLQVFKGVIKGSVHQIAPWKNCTNTVINLNSEHPVNNNMPSKISMVYYGGGEIFPDHEQPVSWIGQYEATGNGAVATFRYGKGTVMLMGPHAELGINGNGSWNTDGGASAQWSWLYNAVSWTLEQ